MDPKKLTHLVKLWQKRLRLQDWKITIRLEPDSTMPTMAGEIHMNESDLDAVLLFNEATPLEKVEPTIVHELLHLRLLPFGLDSDDEQNARERQLAMNLLAATLIKAFSRPHGKKAEGIK